MTELGTGCSPFRPQLAFLGVGWIGLHRMQALARSDVADIRAVADRDPACRQAASTVVPDARLCERFEQLLDLPLDGVVIATPSALHANQSIAALERGLAVFCQKPLARTASEARQVIHAAARSDCLLGVDLSYRYTEAMRRIGQLVRTGELGRIYALDLVFHNAYGPDKPWFYDRSSSGGGCAMDLGIHLIDLALWLLDFPEIGAVDSRIFSRGEPLSHDAPVVEDYATIHLDLACGASVRVACSWGLPAGRAALIEASLYGTQGGAAMRNVDGSFYDFVGERFRGTETETLTTPPDAWGGRALLDWVHKLGRGHRFDPAAASLCRAHEVLDLVYGVPPRSGG